MESVTLNVDIRAQDEKVSHLRKDKIVPGIVYGKTQEPISIKIPNSDLLRAYRSAGESTIIDLKVGKKDVEVLVHNVQRDPVTGDFTHIDFYAVTRGEKVSTKIALSFI
jgi:large subunit ribosomal protein L25